MNGPFETVPIREISAMFPFISVVVRGGAALVALALAVPAAASWPTDPESPLQVGPGAVSGTFSTFGSVAGLEQSTWVAWMDAQCSGNLRVQRVSAAGELLAPDGLLVSTVVGLGCHTTDAIMAALTDGAVIVTRRENNLLPLETQTVHRIAPDGTPQWGPGVLMDIEGNGRIVGLRGLSNGDALIAVHVAGSPQTVRVFRVGPAGEMIWDEPFVIPAWPRSFSFVPAFGDETLLVWDAVASPSYFNWIGAAKVTADGQSAWTEPVTFVTPNNPFASRHTPHAFMSDGEGGLWATYTRGGQQVDTPRPIDVQRVLPDGTLAFETPLRVSMSNFLQASATTWLDEVSGDLLVAWREGDFTAQSIRVQRLTADGVRLFGETGAEVQAVQPTTLSRLITGHWTGTMLLLVVADALADPDETTVHMRRIDGNGGVDPAFYPLSGTEGAGSLMSVAHGDDQVIAWLQSSGSFLAAPVAQYVRSDGTLGQAVVVGDLDGNGIVDISDLLILLSQWGPCANPGDCPADLDQDGSVDLSDLLVLLANWG